MQFPSAIAPLFHLFSSMHICICNGTCCSVFADNKKCRKYEKQAEGIGKANKCALCMTKLYIYIRTYVFLWYIEHTEILKILLHWRGNKSFLRLSRTANANARNSVYTQPYACTYKCRCVFAYESMQNSLTWQAHDHSRTNLNSRVCVYLFVAERVLPTKKRRKLLSKH